MATNEPEADETEVQLKKLKLGPNNPEEAEQLKEDLKKPVDLFENRIHSHACYEVEQAYPKFIDKYAKQLAEVEDYFKPAKVSALLDIIKDKTAKMLLIETAHEWEEQAKCPDSCTSDIKILSGHQMLNKLANLPKFKTIKSGHKMTIAQLFTALQKANNMATEVMDHLTFLGHTLHPEQFTSTLKHSVCPLFQISVPAGLSDPTRLKFEHPALTEKERFEEKVINDVLPLPHHPKLEDLPPKDPTHCLATAVHYTI